MRCAFYRQDTVRAVLKMVGPPWCCPCRRLDAATQQACGSLYGQDTVLLAMLRCCWK